LYVAAVGRLSVKVMVCAVRALRTMLCVAVGAAA
jgi:hypothetical protein